jgi:hypothetical protein
MNEIVQQVSQRTGVAAETVEKVIRSAAEYVKGKLPPQYTGYVDQYVSGQGGAAPANAADAVKGALGGLFGGQG